MIQFLILCILAITAYTDIRTRIIHNRELILLLIISGLYLVLNPESAIQNAIIAIFFLTLTLTFNVTPILGRGDTYLLTILTLTTGTQIINIILNSLIITIGSTLTTKILTKNYPSTHPYAVYLYMAYIAYSTGMIIV